MSAHGAVLPSFATAAGRGNRAVRRAAVCAAVVATALAAPAVASAHPRTTTVAIDYRLTLGPTAAGVQARILDGDRDLRLTVAQGTRVVVLGDLGEPMLRFAPGGVWVNLASPTAQANKLIVDPGKGWKLLRTGRTFAWHEHRLGPPPYQAGVYGPVARWSVPVEVDGRRSAIGGSFIRVPRPLVPAWLFGVAIFVALGWSALKLRPRIGSSLTIAAGAVAGLGALFAETAFTLRDSTTGKVTWVPIAVAAAVVTIAGALLVSGRAAPRAYVAGAIGAGVGALTLSWFGVFLHGHVVAAAPGGPVRFACAAALACGLLALVGSLSLRTEDVR